MTSQLRRLHHGIPAVRISAPPTPTARDLRAARETNSSSKRRTQQRRLDQTSRVLATPFPPASSLDSANSTCVNLEQLGAVRAVQSVPAGDTLRSSARANCSDILQPASRTTSPDIWHRSSASPDGWLISASYIAVLHVFIPSSTTARRYRTRSTPAKARGAAAAELENSDGVGVRCAKWCQDRDGKRIGLGGHGQGS
jgi:hypothetical protein